MARSASPISPTTAMDPHRHRQNSNSPLPQQPSKRDKRRNMIFEKLNEMTAQFATDRDIHYRTELLGIQVGMTLVTEADVHGAERLPVDAEEVETLATNAYTRMMKGPAGEAPHRAGKIYSEFATNVNYAMEERDSELWRLDYQRNRNDSFLDAEHEYSHKLANNELDALSSTTRDRLINSVTMRKNRVLKEKDVTDFGDGNAILLHPSQFGAANPTSPGGMHSKRSTRLRRDAEELPNFAESNKRKRKAGESEDSPAPHRQRMENGTSTPVWLQEKARNTHNQHLSFLYSIEKLFTEKELSMVHHQAALAAHAYMIRQPISGSDDGDSPPNGRNDSNSDQGPAAEGNDENNSRDRQDRDGPSTSNNEPDSPPPSSAPTMEKSYSHATRSTKGGFNAQNRPLGPDDMSTPIYNYHTKTSGDHLGYPDKTEDLTQQQTRLPGPSNVMTKSYVKGEQANQPMGLMPDEAASEHAIIRRGVNFNEVHGLGTNLEVGGGGGVLLGDALRQKGGRGKTFDRALGAAKEAGDANVEGFGNLREQVEGVFGGREGMNVGVGMGIGKNGASETGTATGRATPMSRQGTNEGVTGRARRGKN